MYSLARNMLIHQSIKTTLDRAKACRSLVEELINLARKNTLAAKRRAFQILGDHKLVSNLFNEIGPRFKDRSSGFTRIINLGKRRGDDASIVIFELTEIKKKEIKSHKKAKESKPEKEADSTAQEKEAPKQEAVETQVDVKKRPPASQKPKNKFLGGLRNIFKKERDSL